ncbi:MAG: type II secretion system protein GspE [Myxococcales bacterium]|nr:type II secretion system protein GspE [Myxococcales bacterium]
MIAKPQDLRFNTLRIGEIFVERGWCTANAVDRALAVQSERGGRLGEILISQEEITEDQLLSALSLQSGIELITELDPEAIDPGLVRDMNMAYARDNLFLPIEQGPHSLRVAIHDPFNTFVLDDLQVMFAQEVEPVLVPEKVLLDTVHRVFDRRSAADQVVDEMAEADVGVLTLDLEESTRDILEEEGEAPIIRLVNSVLNQAVKEQVSDIHIEPFEKEIVFRFRKDGVLREIARAPRRFHASISSRIKIMGKLNIAEKRIPQDGRIRIKVAGKDVDIRLSTVPTGHGERLVMRLLDKSSTVLDLVQLGMYEHHRATFEKCISRPHGIVLVTGPTGSGKTTTLYAGLVKINTADINILTIEDPVEYQIPGIGQMQVNPKIGFTFSTGLRAILRQDPDVVLIGETRDLETAEIAVQASLTGHLVFTTLHTNDAAGAFTRLVDMGVEPFLIASTVLCAQAQRLVRKICTECRAPFQPTDVDLQLLGIEKKDVRKDATFFKAVGCDECAQSGYRGRLGLFEILEVSDEVRQLILQKVDAQTIKKKAREQGMKTLRDDGADKVMAGLTTIDEVLRVSQEDND